jgi:hypothetical protein
MTYPEYDPNQAHTQFDPYPGAGAGAPGYNEQNPYQYPPPPAGQPTYPAAAYPPPPPPGYPQSPAGAYPPPPGYPAPGYAPMYVQSAQTNTMAILALIFAFVLAPLGIVFGHMAKKQIKNTGEQGEGLATAGLIIGYIFTGIYIVVCGIYVVVLGALFSTAGAVN